MLRIRPAAPLAVFLLCACADLPQSLVAPPEASEAKGGGRKGSGGGAISGTVEDFRTWDDERWGREFRPAGLGWILPENVAVRGGKLYLSLPAGSLDGGSVYSTSLHRYGVYEARMRAAASPGAVSAFFLYGSDGAGNFNEIDIEVVRDRGQVWFTVWTEVPEAGPYHSTYSQAAELDFDPLAFHVYRISFEEARLRFYVDDRLYAEFSGDLPRGDMRILANAWFPWWLYGAPSHEGSAAVVDWIRWY